MHSEHLRRDPLPQDDLAGGDRRRHRDLHHRLHVLRHCEWALFKCDLKAERDVLQLAFRQRGNELHTS